VIAPQAGDHQVWSYSVTVPSSATGAVTLDYAAGQYTDGAGNPNAAAVQVSRAYDTTAVAPQPVLSLASGVVEPATGAFGIEMSLGVAGLAGQLSDTWFDLTHCQGINGFGPKPGETTIYQATVTPEAGHEGDVTVRLKQGQYADGGIGNAESNLLTVAADTRFALYSYPDPTTAIPIARESMRYQVVLWADVAIPAGHSLIWSIESVPMIDVFEFVDDPVAPVANQKILRTKVDGSNVTYIPGDGDPTPWGGTVQAIPVKAVLVNASGDVALGEATFQLTVEDTKSAIDVAILLDRSGSMAGNRWKAAMSGAAMFANLLADCCTVTPGAGIWTTSPHRAGLYWFWGHNSAAYGDNYPNPGGPIAGYTGGFHNSFEDNESDTYQLPDGATLGKPDKISAVPSAGTMVETVLPDHYTALGSGLLHCRKDLMDNDTGSNEKVILALSDGMENRQPDLTRVFLGADPMWFHQDADLGQPAEDPNIRIYFNAVLTSPSWVARLRDVVAKTGGIKALDVKSITGYGEYGSFIQKWFVTSFKRLFGFIALDEIPDPVLSQGQVGSHPVTVNLGNDKLVFYSLFENGDADKWTFSVTPPGCGFPVIHAAASAHAGIRFSGDARYKMISVDLPLGLDGQAHRWPGEWTMTVRRDGADSGSYAVGALARADLGTTVDLVAPPDPKPGASVTVSVRVRDQRGRPIEDARVVTRVRRPGPWPGDAVAAAFGSDPALVESARRSKSAASLDTTATADRVLRELYAAGELDGGKTTALALAHVGDGVYRAQVKLARPGVHDFDTTITGVRRGTAAEVAEKIGAAKEALSAHYKGAALKAEKAYLKAHAGILQPFRIESREQLTVDFLPSAKISETGGYFVDAGTIRLLVQPKDKAGTLLGPGWGGSILFFAPGGVELPWPAVDLGDGNYQADLEVHRKGDVRFERLRLALAADAFALVHPAAGPVELPGGLLPLAEFAVEALGVRMPIAVMSLVGNAKTRECHLVTCRFAARIAPRNKVWLHDLGQARRAGYDTCEHCLPLVCNMSPESMEAHKPFCRWVRKIQPKNRIEIHSLERALELGFDGCKYCLPGHHKR
jgi:hypothetical protein